jgi:Rieske Fe-S protein
MDKAQSPSIESKQSLPEYALLSRRNVIKLIGSACAVSSLNGCVIADVFTELGTSFAFDLSDPKYTALNTVGEAVDIDDAAGRPVILIRVNENEIMAVNRICTHTQCDMKLGAFGAWDGEKIICRCHNSHFAPSGEVLNGPATEALPAYQVNFNASSGSAEILFSDEEPMTGTQAGETAGMEAGEQAGDMAGMTAGEMTAGESTISNPFEGDANAVSEGEGLYQNNCVFCHGENGVGETFPGADAFNIDQSAWTDAHLYDVISNGITGTSMSAYKDTLSEDEIWKVVSYLRSLRTDQ